MKTIPTPLTPATRALGQAPFACSSRRLALAVLGLACASSASAAVLAYETAVLAQDPYSFHRFNESSGTSAADTSGNSRPGTYVGSPTLGLAGAGGTGSDNAVGFNGSSQYMTISNTASLGTSLKNVTFETVFRTTTTTDTTLFGTVNDDQKTAVIMSLNFGAVGTHRFFMRDSSGASNASGQFLTGTFTNNDLIDGDYRHMMVSVDLSAAIADRYKIYVDGNAQAVTVAGSSSPLSSSTATFATFQYDFAVGAMNNRGSFIQHFNGTIDEFAIYDKTLTSTNAAAHFSAIPEPSTAGLAALAALALLRRRRF